MTTTTLAVRPNSAQLIHMVLATCVSSETRRSYAGQLEAFIQSGHPLNREGVALYLQSRREAGAGGATITQSVCAIRKLAAEAQMRGLITFEELSNIRSLKAGKQYRTKAGNWLTLAQVRQILALPDRSTYFGKRDAAILSVLIGCGLRRAEMAQLPWSCYQSREGRMCLVDVLGKGNKHRTIPVPIWAQRDVDMWSITLRGAPALGIEATHIRRGRTKACNEDMFCGGIGYDAIKDLVESYGQRIGVSLAPHDLRRTLAQILRRSGAPLEQIQHTLGHQRLETTNVYLGSCLELGRGVAAVDKLDLGAEVAGTVAVDIASGDAPLGATTGAMSTNRGNGVKNGGGK